MEILKNNLPKALVCLALLLCCLHRVSRAPFGSVCHRQACHRVCEVLPCWCCRCLVALTCSPCCILAATSGVTRIRQTFVWKPGAKQGGWHWVTLQIVERYAHLSDSVYSLVLQTALAWPSFVLAITLAIVGVWFMMMSVEMVSCVTHCDEMTKEWKKLSLKYLDKFKIQVL